MLLTFVIIPEGFDLYFHIRYSGRQLGVNVSVPHALVTAIYLPSSCSCCNTLLLHLDNVD